MRTFGSLIDGGPLRLIGMLVAATLLVAVETVVATRPPLRFDLGTLAVVYFALESPVAGGAVASLLVGLVADVFSGESRGLSSASMMVAYLVVRLLVARSTGARWGMITAVSLLGTSIVFFVRFALEAAVGPDRATFDAASPALPFLLLGAVLFGYPVYRFLRWVDERFRPRDDDAGFRMIPRR
ncbi:hypothetical protein L6R52_16340 [Myxococcota bacterium]|nr:hypothetical protein [Myxococcota bacterium]